jgi:hypothetical protein
VPLSRFDCQLDVQSCRHTCFSGNIRSRRCPCVRSSYRPSASQKTCRQPRTCPSALPSVTPSRCRHILPPTAIRLSLVICPSSHRPSKCTKLPPAADPICVQVQVTDQAPVQIQLAYPVPVHRVSYQTVQIEAAKLKTSER